MSTESVAPLLKKIRTHLLEVAGSNPSTPASPTPLPGLDEIVANSGSGPFRCHKCRASLLRGPDSQICSACGTEREGVASFRISFSSTMAYQLLMASFQPQGSEVTTANSTPHIEVASLQTELTEPKDGLVACDILNLVLKWPEDKARSKEHTSVTQTASTNAPRELGVDLEDFFGQSKSHNVSDFPKEVFTSTHHIEDVKWQVPAVSMPQLSASESHIDLFGAQPGRQQTQTHTRDDDPFGDFECANSTYDNSESKNIDTPAASSDDFPFNLTEGKKVSDWAVASRSTFHGQDLFADTVSGMEHAMHMQGSWIEDDPWSAMITEEPYRGSSKNLKESSGLQSDWPETFILAESQDPFAGSVWQQGDISQHNVSTTEKSRSHTTGDSGGEELDVLFASNPASQVLKLDKETTSRNTTLTEIDLFNRVECREVNDQAKPKSASLEMDDLMVAMPKGSSNDDSDHVVESLLSQMHDLSFMLADHLVIPDGNKEHSICL